MKKRDGYFYVLVLVHGEWLYLSDKRCATLDYTRYPNLAKVYYSHSGAKKKAAHLRLTGLEARTTQGYIK